MPIRITKSTISKPPKICIYGQHGVGKSSFGAGCSAPIFISTEDGLGSLGVDTFDLALRYEDVMASLDHLMTHNHNYKTVIIDSLDWLEKLIYKKICIDKQVSDIGALPFGRGYGFALQCWEEVTDMLSILNKDKKMFVVLLAHAQIKKFEDPERDNYDRYNLDLQSKAAAHIAEFVDILGYASFKAMTVSKESGFGQTSVKAKGTGERVLNLEERPAFTAKNRYGLPAQLPLNWAALLGSLKEKMASKKEDDTKHEGVSSEKQAPTESNKATGNLGGAKETHEKIKEENKKLKEVAKV